MRALICALSLASAAAVAALPAVDGDLRLRPFTSETFGNSRVLRVLLPSGYDAPANRNRRISRVVASSWPSASHASPSICAATAESTGTGVSFNTIAS